MPIKFLVLGGGSANFVFMGAGIFLITEAPKTLALLKCVSRHTCSILKRAFFANLRGRELENCPWPERGEKAEKAAGGSFSRFGGAFSDLLLPPFAIFHPPAVCSIFGFRPVFNSVSGNPPRNACRIWDEWRSEREREREKKKEKN